MKKTTTIFAFIAIATMFASCVNGNTETGTETGTEITNVDSTQVQADSTATTADTSAATTTTAIDSTSTK
jgi:hypothetical protein